MADPINKLAPAGQAVNKLVDPSLSLMGGVVNQKLKPIYAQYEFLRPYLDDPQKLMKFIDIVHERESRRSPGSEPDLWTAMRAQDALKAIYGINAYHPKGFLQYSTEPGMAQQLGGRVEYSERGGWIDPRPYGANR